MASSSSSSSSSLSSVAAEQEAAPPQKLVSVKIKIPMSALSLAVTAAAASGGKEPPKRKRPAPKKKAAGATTTTTTTTTTGGASGKTSASKSRKSAKSRIKATATEKAKNQATSSSNQRLCFNQLCRNKPRPRSKYCSEACGLAIACELIQLRTAHRKRESDINAAKLLVQKLVDSPSEQSQADSTDLALLNQIDDTLSIVDENIKHLLDRQKELVDTLQRLINGSCSSSSDGAAAALDDQEDDETNNNNNNNNGGGGGADGSRDVEEARQLMKETETEIDCLSCGKPWSSRVYLKHIQSCSRSKEERDTFFGSDMNASNSILCGTVFCEKILDKRTMTPCDRLFASCQFHSKERRDEREQSFGIRFAALPVCGAPTTQFASGHCELNPTSCQKHAGWHQVRFDELLQEIVKQEQLQKRLTREQEDICLRLSVRRARTLLAHG